MFWSHLPISATIKKKKESFGQQIALGICLSGLLLCLCGLNSVTLEREMLMFWGKTSGRRDRHKETS